jgi:hypothetical protein
MKHGDHSEYRCYLQRTALNIPIRSDGGNGTSAALSNVPLRKSIRGIKQGIHAMIHLQKKYRMDLVSANIVEWWMRNVSNSVQPDKQGALDQIGWIDCNQVCSEPSVPTLL